MQIKTKTRFEPLKDGICAVYTADRVLRHEQMHYDNRIVGSKRFFQAAAQDRKIDKIIRTRLLDDVMGGDIAVLLDEKEYSIIQVQHMMGTNPPCMDLSLQATGLMWKNRDETN